MKAQEIILQQILAGLEMGEIPRQKTRVSRGPINMVSKKQYRGFNSMLLQWKARKNNWSKYWLTKKQCLNLGGRIIYEEFRNTTQVIRYNIFEKKEVNKKGEHDKIPVLRYYQVYNLSQCTGIELPIEAEVSNEKLPEAEKVVNTYLNRESILVSDGEPKYLPLVDGIDMPNISSFTNSAEFYTAYFHEITHSTGAEKRLDRKLTTDKMTGEYSKEELVAEVGASILCNETGTPLDIKNVQAYINGRCRYIKDKPGEVITAFTKAMKACEYVLDINQEDNV